MEGGIPMMEDRYSQIQADYYLSDFEQNRKM